MIQQFIELGQGYGDVYELCELIQTNKVRFHEAFIFTSTKNEQTFCSLAVAFQPVGESKFMPIYICREGIPYSAEKTTKRITLFTDALASIDKKATTLEVKHSSIFSETNQFYQYLIGILRMSRYIPPMQ
ncbi:DUF7147 family protein [Lysinibacillus sp. LZ02]|uniref:DUF7147 family protein n=1 Tax=Lysinibacillus sp. LZ02 TaxID=3420668 RepID=UPI003D3639DC